MIYAAQRQGSLEKSPTASLEVGMPSTLLTMQHAPAGCWQDAGLCQPLLTPDLAGMAEMGPPFLWLPLYLHLAQMSL